MEKNNLHNIKGTGFKIPKDYFENLEDIILSEAKLSETIETSGLNTPSDYFEGLEDVILSKAKLNEKVSDSGFKVPENYFETIENTIIKTTIAKQEPKVISLFNRKTLLYVSSIAAAVVLFFSLPIISGSDGDIISFADVDTEFIDSYVLDETQTTDIAALFTETELENTSFIDYNLSDETLDSYLEDLDENELILQ